jgi:hypothetical protein
MGQLELREDRAQECWVAGRCDDRFGLLNRELTAEHLPNTCRTLSRYGSR